MSFQHHSLPGQKKKKMCPIKLNYLLETDFSNKLQD